MPIPMLFLPPQNDNTRKWAKAVADACPNTVFILTGYSQGADVAGDVAAAARLLTTS